MYFPTLQELETSRTMIDVFAGYNHNLRIGESEFYDMKNLTSSHYPVLSPRERRGVYAIPENPIALISKDFLCYVDGSEFVINGFRVDMGLSAAPEDCPKQLISMGAYVIILPDKKYINMADISDFGDIENNVTTTSTVSFELSKVDGTRYENMTISAEEPSNPANMSLWIDTSSTPHSLKQYAEASAMWVSIATTYVRIAATGIGKGFSVGDGVTISGIEIEALKDLNNTMTIQDKDDDYIVVIGLIDEVVTQDAPITVARSMPNMDFVIESENRLWGCRYGTAVNGEIVNEIYASKLGDFRNWNCFAGISTDSYVASVGTDGPFTGAITHLGYPLFFKENYLHKVYGNYPANYQIQTTACRGVQKGCGKSLAIVNEALFYKSRIGVCVYDGSLPQEISAALGDISYSGAIACAHGNKYYISMRDDTGIDASLWLSPVLNNSMLFVQQAYGIIHNENVLILDGWESPQRAEGICTLYIQQAYSARKSLNRLILDRMDVTDKSRWVLFVYDVSKGLWHKEDNTRVDDFCSCGGELYYIDHYEKTIKTVFGSGTKENSKVEWMAETGIIGSGTPDRKYISKLNVRMSLDLSSRTRFYVQYDSVGDWEYLFSMEGTSLKSFTIPIKPKRCDHLRLRIEGVGEAKIFSITKTMEQGSDR